MNTLKELLQSGLECHERQHCYSCPHNDELGCDFDWSKWVIDAIHYLKEYESALKFIDENKQIVDDAVRQRDKHIKALADLKRKEKEVDDMKMMLVNANAQMEDNQPLTWEELKGMKGKPVWVETNYAKDKKVWYLICDIDDSFMWVADPYGYQHNFPRVCLDTDLWRAYRKEQNHENT